MSFQHFIVTMILAVALHVPAAQAQSADPLARPVVRLPAPAYYASGLALATGVNWLSWKMGHSRRWDRLALLPQLFSIAGSTSGFKSNYNYD